MFYDAVKNDHGLKYDPVKALVCPRPIGWVSTLSSTGVANLAPYSFFNMVAEKPAYVFFSSSGSKDSWRNAEATGEFVFSLATYELRDRMNMTAAVVPPEVSEFELAGLTPAPSHFVKPPRVAESPAALECRYWKTVELPDHDGKGKQHAVVFGLVVGIHIEERAIKDGIIDTGALGLITRLGYRDYGILRPDDVFTMGQPYVDANGNVGKKPPPK
ncbi:MAG: hypothetical protein RLZ98_184 [Pseudomonadota bacterium]|jgi:flavin reductase (DIM6/NTAB) family NADH-FMN oxidoreductase RutF